MQQFTVDKLIAGLLSSNIRFRYGWLENFGEYNHRHLFIIGERTDNPGIQFIEEMSRGQETSQLRFYYVDVEAPEESMYLKEIPYEYPLPISPVAITYDGNQYLYVIYNKYNIWRLNFKAVLEDPSGSYWFRLPPCINCNFLGDSRTDPKWSCYFIKPRYLALVSKDGMFARMDTETFAWFLDKMSPPEIDDSYFNSDVSSTGDVGLMFENISSILQNVLPEDLYKNNETGENYFDSSNKSLSATAQGLDKDEIYLVKFGSIFGKVMNVYDRQWDNFYFDTRIARGVIKYFSPALEQNVWPLFIKRRRLYTTNELGHLFYAWLRIDGYFDVEYQLQKFYQGDEIRIYTDYTGIQQWTNFKVLVYGIKSGWVEISQDKFEPVVEEIGWDWDSEYTRQYVKVIPRPDGQVSFRYTKVPPIYVKVDISHLNEPISKIRVIFSPLEKETNYVVRINKVELISNQEILNIVATPDEDNPLEVIRIEPLQSGQDYSTDFAVYVKNKGDKTVKDVITYVVDNQWLQMTLDDTDENSWYRYNQDNPLKLGDIDPDQVVKFYIRAVNIDERPHSQDLVVVGIYPYV